MCRFHDQFYHFSTQKKKKDYERNKNLKNLSLHEEIRVNLVKIGK